MYVGSFSKTFSPSVRLGFAVVPQPLAEPIAALPEGAALDVPGAVERPQDALADYARALLETITMPRGVTLMRLIIASVAAEPDLALSVFNAGARASRAKLAAFLARETGAGRLAIDDVDEAADFFAGMVVSHRQISLLLGLPSDLTNPRIERIATEAARRFLRAYRA